MTVVLTTRIQTWIGLSTDTKPSAPPAGSTFYETDSGATHVYDGSAWQLRLDAGPYKVSKTEALNGSNNHGELDQPTVSLFTVTGEVLIVALVPFCTEDLVSAGGGTLALGVTGSTALLIPATTATAIDVNEFWLSNAPAANGALLPANLQNVVVTDNVIATVATADITDGTIRFDMLWLPLSSNGLVVAA